MFFILPLSVSGLSLEDIHPYLYNGVSNISLPVSTSLTEDPVSSGSYRIDGLPDSTRRTIRYTLTVEYPAGVGYSFNWGGEDTGTPTKIIIPVRESDLLSTDFLFTVYRNGIAQGVTIQVDPALQVEGDYSIFGWPITSSGAHWLVAWSRVGSDVSSFYTWEEITPLVVPSSLGGLFPAPILRLGIKIADSLTKGVQSYAVLEPWLEQSVHGDDVYGLPVPIQCIVDRTNKMIEHGGEQITVGATLTVIGDIQPNGATGRREPIDPRDRITLPDGFTGPVISSPNSVIDPSTNRGFIHEIMLGMR